MELDINFNAFKRIHEEFNKRKPMGFSGITHYANEGNSYILYLATPDFTYRCVVNKKEVRRVDEINYIKYGINVNGRLTNVLVQQITVRPEIPAETKEGEE